jgi:hypothetical protein
MEQEVYTLDEYCAVEKISRAKVYDEWKRGGGVDFYKRGTKILISHEARLRHRNKLEQEAREKRAALDDTSPVQRSSGLPFQGETDR